MKARLIGKSGVKQAIPSKAFGRAKHLSWSSDDSLETTLRRLNAAPACRRNGVSITSAYGPAALRGKAASEAAGAHVDPVARHRADWEERFPMEGTRSGTSECWQRPNSIQLLAAAIGVLPLYSSLIIFQLHRGQPPSVQGFIFYLAVISPLAIVVALVLLRVLCKETPKDLNLRAGKVSSDLLATLLLSTFTLLANVVANAVLSGLLPESATTSVRDLFLEMTRTPASFVVFAGPLLLFGAASEELIRAFLLSRLWKVWGSQIAKLLAVLVSACLFGLIHVYRGPLHVAWTGIYGLIMGLYYLRFGRLAPLILAHYATNALQVFVVAAQAP